MNNDEIIGSKTMRSIPFKSYWLGIIFIIAVMVPAIILSFLAFRSADLEELYLEKQLKTALLAELTHTVSVIHTEINSLREELGASAILPKNEDYRQVLERWKQTSPVIEVPFLLAPDRKILWPNLDRRLSEEERLFLSSNIQFLSDQKPIPIYQDIAAAYQKEIMEEAGRLQGSPREADLAAGGEKSEAVGDPRNRLYKYEARQQALSQFQSDEAIRQKVYEQAETKGQQVFSRNVAPKAGLSPKENRDLPSGQAPRSQYVSEPLTFSQITAAGDSGLIPRSVDGKLTLIFWKKDNGYIVGCRMNETELKARVISVLPDAYSSARILTVLDERGSPLFNPVPQRTLDWRRPFAALEIGELLPHWEVATYLTDPQALTSRARSTTWIGWMLILLLFVSIAAGGTIVLRTLFSQVRLAQQKTTFVANVSHELKTPLTSIRLFTELLREKRQPDETRQRQYLDMMVSETERLTRLINNVLDFSRMAEGKKRYTMKFIDAVGLCREMVENQRVRLELNGFSLTFTPELQSIAVKADEEALRQVLINLLSNAEKYSLEGKQIEVEVAREKGSVFIRVKDRGIGLRASESEKIFKEFYRVDDSLTSRVKGTGLGLTIARRIARDHGGDLRHFPREDGGSVFQIQLPIAEAPLESLLHSNGDARTRH